MIDCALPPPHYPLLCQKIRKVLPVSCGAASNIGRIIKSLGRYMASLWSSFLSSFAMPPEELILDFDATDDVVHGNQEGRFSMVTMIITVSCLSMFSAAVNYWLLTCDQLNVMQLSMRELF
ncbi:Transposase DDE domain group 1 [Nitrosomonas sp. Nm132]|nr:Transposase DDE domain group 1 [Nitrosomonas sp. Nm132]